MWPIGIAATIAMNGAHARRWRDRGTGTCPSGPGVPAARGSPPVLRSGIHRPAAAITTQSRQRASGTVTRSKDPPNTCGANAATSGWVTGVGKIRMYETIPQTAAT